MRYKLMIIAMLFAFIFILESYDDSGKQEEITKQIKAINGEVINIEEKSIYFDNTPFTVNTKEMRIYTFKYKINNEEKTGWVRFKTFNDDWIMDSNTN